MIYFLFPETKGLQLEDIDHLFMDKSESGNTSDSPGAEKITNPSAGDSGVNVRHVDYTGSAEKGPVPIGGNTSHV